MNARIDESQTGVCAILATPFDNEGNLDVASIPTLVEFYLEAGSTGLTILGMMGEAPKLSFEESAAVIDEVLRVVDGRVPVVVGVSNPGMASLSRLAGYAMDRGAAGVMIAPISTLRTEDQVAAYFDSVLNSLGPQTPVVFQDYPPVTGVNVSANSLALLVEKHPQIVMIKHEDSPGLNKLSNFRAMSEKRGLRRVSILVGNNGLYLPQELTRGADGAMTGFAYPEMLADVCKHFANGNPGLGEDIFDIYLPIVRYEAQLGVGLAVRKEILRRRGAISSAHVRAPGPRLTDQDHKELDNLISRLDGKLAALPSRRNAT